MLLGNGWYDCIKQDYGQLSILSLILIKHEYTYQNEYLDNEYYKDFKISKSVKIQKEKGLYNIYSSDNNFLFSLEFDPKVELSGSQKKIINLLNIVGIIFLVLLLCLLARRIFKRDAVYLCVISIVLIILRFILTYFRIPHSFFSSAIFSPMLYASSTMLPSLGHMLMDSVIILLIVVLVFKSQVSSFKFLFLFISVFILFGAFVGFEYVFRSLIFNSNIVFNFNNILNLSAYSIIGLIIISGLIFTYYILILLFTRRILIKLSVRQFVLVILANLFLFLIAFSFRFQSSGFRFQVSDRYLYLIVPLLIISIVWYFNIVSSFKSQVSSP